MIGEKGFRGLAERVLAISKGDQTEVLFQCSDSALTRFANSVIHQNVAESSVGVRVRIIVGQRTGVATTTDTSGQGLERVVDVALQAARHQPDNPQLPSMPSPTLVPAVQGYSGATASFSPEERARAAGVFCSKARAHELSAAGAVSTSLSEIGIVNSFGHAAYEASTSSDVSTVIMGETSSGYASRAAVDVTTLDVESLADEAVSTALRARNPHSLPAGRYPVILAPYAVQDLCNMFAFLSFNALAVQEERSFLRGQTGKRVMSPLITIWDDGLDSECLPMGFDFEGTPKQRVELIHEGVALGVVYDTATAAKDGKRSTGHGLPAPNPEGPLALHLHVAPGDATLEQMIRSVDGGLLVTRFHYTRPVHPTRVVVTGMTRDGTFWVERGEIAYAVKNLRFTQSYVDALATVNAVGRDVWTLGSMLGIGGTRAPALSLPEFEFTGVTEF